VCELGYVLEYVLGAYLDKSEIELGYELGFELEYVLEYVLGAYLDMLENE
jgi:hypothetical protein